MIPANVEVTETRNYGETANDKARSSSRSCCSPPPGGGAGVLRAWQARGRDRRQRGHPYPDRHAVRPWAWGFTLNRVSLFALIFSIGILVDDAIVVVENIHRHQAPKR